VTGNARFVVWARPLKSLEFATVDSTDFEKSFGGRRAISQVLTLFERTNHPLFPPEIDEAFVRAQ
jgi:hypothetical protein